MRGGGGIMSHEETIVLYSKYNSARRPEFRLATEICEDKEGRFVRKRAAGKEAEAHLKTIRDNHTALQDYYRDIRIADAKQEGDCVCFPFIKGKTLEDIAGSQYQSKEDYLALVKGKMESVLAVKDQYRAPFQSAEAFEAVFGKVQLDNVPALTPANVDSLLSNFIENDDGVFCIDCEWVFPFAVPVNFIRFRILLYLYTLQTQNLNIGLSLDEMFSFFGISEEEIKVYREMDDRFQQYVHGDHRKFIYTDRYRKQDLSIEGIDQKLKDQEASIAAKDTAIRDKDEHIRNLELVVSNREKEVYDKEVHIQDLNKIIHDKDVYIQDQNKIIHDKDVHIQDLNKIIYDKDVHIGNQEKIIHDKDVHIGNQDARIRQLTADYEAVTNAFFWRITGPARKVLTKVKQSALKHEKVYLGLRMGKDTLRHGFSYANKRRKNYLAGKKKAREAAAWPSEEIRAAQRKEKFPKDITFSLLVPLYNTPEEFLREMIESVQEQTYCKWELCLADGSDAEHEFVGKVCHEYMKKDRRILYKKLEKNLGISGNTNACIEMATGNFIALFDHDDILHPSVLYEAMKAICEKDADYVYTDEVTFESPDKNKLITLHYKPDFAPDNLLANNYICHFSTFSTELLKKVGGFRSAYDGSQDHDIMLRLTHAAKNVVHIPKILYWWRSHPLSVSQDIGAKQYAVDAAKRCVHDFILENHHAEAVIESTRAFPTIFRIIWPIQGQPKVSIVIPNKDHLEDLQRCVSSILQKSTYGNYEIVVVENNSETEEIFAYYKQLEGNEKVRVLHYKGEFNYSKINNWAVDQCDGDYVVLLNNDTEVITPEWIENMLMYAQREDVGAVGAKLYFPDGRIQHAGVVIKMGDDRIAAHSYYGAGHDHIGYMGRLCYAQDVSAVTGACLMISRKKYEEVKGLDEGFAVAYNDVDFCLKVRDKGYLNIFTPFAELYHHESATRGYETGEKLKRQQRECEIFRNKWSKVLEEGDPYFNPNLSLDSPMFEPW